MTVAEELHRKIEDRDAVVGVVGLGYVGLPVAVRFAQRGFRTVGLDVQERVVERVNRGDSHVMDIPSRELDAPVGRGPLEATADLDARAGREEAARGYPPAGPPR